jgi:hypothetical protein
VQDGFKRQLLANKADIHRILEDPTKRRGVELLLDSKDIDSLLKIADATKEHQRTLLVRHMKFQKNQGRRAFELLQRGDVAELNRIVRDLGGKDSPGGRALQSGLIQHVMDISSEFDKARHMIRPQTFIDTMEGLRKSGKLGAIMSDENLGRLEDLKALASFLFKEAGVGEGIQTAVVAAGIAPTKLITHPHRFLAAINTQFSNYMMASFYLSPFVSRVVRLPTRGDLNISRTDASYLRMLASGLMVALEHNEKNAKALFGEQELGPVVDILQEEMDKGTPELGDTIEVGAEELVGMFGR